MRTSTPAGPLNRARARQLNLQVSSVLNSCQSYLDNGDTYPATEPLHLGVQTGVSKMVS